MKVIYHIDEKEKWDLVLGNAMNMLNYGKENNTTFEIEIVANGIAVTGLFQHEAEEANLYSRMEELDAQKVTFAACNNALKKYTTPNTILCPFAAVVPAGVVELAQKQQEGYSYIKP